MTAHNVDQRALCVFVSVVMKHNECIIIHDEFRNYAL